MMIFSVRSLQVNQYATEYYLLKMIIRYKDEKLNACLYQSRNNYNNIETYTNENNNNLLYYSLLPVIQCFLWLQYRRNICHG